MLHKIERITSIGKFRNYLATGDIAFKKLTLFYADNGSGKSTLTSVLRSLATNSPGILRLRKSTGATDSQGARIVERNSAGDVVYDFSEQNGWNRSLGQIEIFDAQFVNDNIYSGFEFGDEHRKQLHQFVVGSQGVSIAREIEQNKEAKSEKRATIASIANGIIGMVSNGITDANLPSFLALRQTELERATASLPTAEAAFANASANASIQTMAELTRIRSLSFGIDLERLSSDLEAVADTIRDRVLADVFAAHCQDLALNGLPDAESWLEKGFGFVKTKEAGSQSPPPPPVNCPFCQQSIQALDIVRAYAAKFSDQYSDFVSRLNGFGTSLAAIGLGVFKSTTEQVLRANGSLKSSWEIYVPVGPEVSGDDILGAIDLLSSEIAKVEEELERKIQNPTTALTNHGVGRLADVLVLLEIRIVQYNLDVDRINRLITNFRSSIPTVSQAMAELERLRRLIRRFDEDVLAQIEIYGAEKADLRRLDEEYVRLIQVQEAAAGTFLVEYQGRINHYLEQVFRTPFRIESVTHIAPQGRATQSKLTFKLTIEGHDISFDPENPTNAKDTLSEGDKSTLALAFFMSKLDVAQGVPDRIVVFDDPLSSFDSNRRGYTLQVCQDLLGSAAQLVVLSHSEYFLYELGKRFEPAVKKTLRIYVDLVSRSSHIENFSLETLVENKYFTRLKALEAFLSNPDLSQAEVVLGWIRNVLEAHLRFKFFRQLRSLSPDNQTLGRIIDKLVSENVVFRENQNRDRIVQSLRTLNGASLRSHHGDPNPDPVLAVDPVRLTVTELASFVQDTFQLVDTLL